MKLDTIARSTPAFDFVQYFEGYTKASGWFTDRFGNIKRHFCGDFNGTRTDDGFVLDETLYYVDGQVEKRQWLVSIDEQGLFTARSEALVGNAEGRIVGNTLNLAYTMRVQLSEGKEWVLGMDDWMLYQPDGSLHNSTFVSKWGFHIGTVSTQYYKHEGEQRCRTA